MLRAPWLEKFCLLSAGMVPVLVQLRAGAAVQVPGKPVLKLVQPCGTAGLLHSLQDYVAVLFRRLVRFQKLVQRQRHLRQKQIAFLRASPAPSKWYAWVSAKYWKYADKIEGLARKSSAGRFFSTTFGLKPQGLALGVAEGTILFKATSPVVLPLQLFLVVSFFKQQRLKTFLASAPASCDEGYGELRVE